MEEFVWILSKENGLISSKNLISIIFLMKVLKHLSLLLQDPEANNSYSNEATALFKKDYGSF